MKGGCNTMEETFISVSRIVAPIIFFFTVFSFLGWALENMHSFFSRGIFMKPNFLLGPFKPMYGIAPILLLYTITENTQWPFVILLCFLVPTTIEYVSGVMLEKLTRKKWWDYKGNRFNVQGHICLTYSICWIFLSLLSVLYIYPIVKISYVKMESVLLMVWPLFIMYFLFELTLALKRHVSKKNSFHSFG